MQKHLPAVMVLALMAFVACGSSAGSVDGGVGATSLSVADATFYQDESFGVTEVSIVDVGNLCGYFGQAQIPEGMGYLVLDFAPKASAGPFSVGTGGSDVRATWGRFGTGQVCTSEGTDATTGSAMITSSSPDEVDGNFDLMFDQDHVSGTFHATYCLRTYINGEETCVPKN